MKTALYGAIIGDMVGSPYEGRLRVIKTKNFPFFRDGCRFTDDTTSTVAVADALLDVGTATGNTLKAIRNWE